LRRTASCLANDRRGVGARRTRASTTSRRREVRLDLLSTPRGRASRFLGKTWRTHRMRRRSANAPQRSSPSPPPHTKLPQNAAKQARAT